MDTEPPRISITLFGDGGCGKSSITLRLVRSQWISDYDPTIEDSYTLTRRIDGQTYHLSLTDTAGQEEYRGMWGAGGANLNTADAFLLVYDITNARSLEGLGFFWDVVEMVEEERWDRFSRTQYEINKRGRLRGKGGGGGNRNSRARGKENMKGFVKPVKIVAGNKCDLAEMREVPAREGLDWARSRECGFMETSARNTVNIEETFELIVRRVVDARRRAGLLPNGESAGGEGWGDDDDDVWDGEDGEDGGGFKGEEVEGDAGGGLGTRRAVTRPLSPLKEGKEKDKGEWDKIGRLAAAGEEKRRNGNWFKRLWWRVFGRDC